MLYSQASPKKCQRLLRAVLNLVVSDITRYKGDLFTVDCFFMVQVSEEEDRRRLKEKLKEALESAARNAVLSEESEHEVQKSDQNIIVIKNL